MVYAGLYPIDGADFPELREALDKLQLNDAALTYEPETSGALGFGFRIGFLGLLHMEIVRERLEREFDLDLISTAPNVVYRVVMEDHSEHIVTNPSEFPEGKIAAVYEPVAASILSPLRHRHAHGSARIGVAPRRAWTTVHDRVEITITPPLAEIVYDFRRACRVPRATPRSRHEPMARQADSSRSTSSCTVTRSTRSAIVHRTGLH